MSGAIYLDSDYGLGQVKRVLQPFFEELLRVNHHVAGGPPLQIPGRNGQSGTSVERGRQLPTDNKSRLQQLTQSEFRQQPRYELINTRGPAHAPTFSVAVVLDGRDLSSASGKTVRGAEQTAAGRAIRVLEKELRRSRSAR
ncbi:MAG: hypothetical protein F4Y46_02030 [Chloroflexi bacterium]|nr:hypothetical protein [Chloroflexota bacterium]